MSFYTFIILLGYGILLGLYSKTAFFFLEKFGDIISRDSILRIVLTNVSKSGEKERWKRINISVISSVDSETNILRHLQDQVVNGDDRGGSNKEILLYYLIKMAIAASLLCIAKMLNVIKLHIS